MGGGPKLADVLVAAASLSSIAALLGRVLALIATRPATIVVASLPDDVAGTYTALLAAIDEHST